MDVIHLCLGECYFASQSTPDPERIYHESLAGEYASVNPNFDLENNTHLSILNFAMLSAFRNAVKTHLSILTSSVPMRTNNH